ncbi:MAG TPA: ABC transporter ATP-binding protein [Candidatus Competibacteraceae bacterium]|nr:ABC transporter ATP-binding protein [Candidatus Competibacteraceae bacterium]
MAHVSFENIDKIYPGGTQAIFDFNLAIADGERVALVGPSGCGKSTLLRLLAGLEVATRGVLSINGQTVNRLSPQQRNVAMVFQDYALYPHMTVRRNLEFPLKMRGLSRAEIERQVHWVTGLLSLSDLLDRLPRQLSGGQRQRVAMGRALVRQPAVFLMDEPLSNLDARLRLQIRSEISELLERTGATTLYVTHDQAEAMTLGQRVAVLDQGRLRQTAPPQELYERPANTFVAGFIGNPPMNLLPARLIVTSEDRLRLRLGEQSLPLTLSASTAALWRQWLETPLSAGIRPEHLRMATEKDEGLRAMVQDAEYLGHETLLYLRIDGLAPPAPVVIMRLPGIRIFHKGDMLRLFLSPAHLHLFDAAGLALDHGITGHDARY